MNKKEVPKLYGPVYKLIRDDILRGIACGIYPPGSMLARQEVLAEKYRVSRTTVRKALNDLSDRGIIHSVKGVGTFVRDNGDTRLDKSISFSRSGTGWYDGQVDSIVLDFKYVSADAIAADVLRCEKGERLAFLKRIRRVDGVPQGVQSSLTRMALLGDLKLERYDFRNTSLFGVLEKHLGMHINRVRCELHAVVCPEDIAAYLGLDEGEPVLSMRRVASLETGVPIEYCEDYERSDVRGMVFEATETTPVFTKV